MLQLTYGLVFVLVAAVCVLWVLTLSKLLPLYRSGAVAGGYRTAFQVVIALLSWVTMQIIVWLCLQQDGIAMMLSVLWAIGLLAWLTLTAVGRTRRQMLSETAQAQPQAIPTPRRVDPLQPAKPDLSKYTVRSVGERQEAAPRSSRVRKIQSMGESYGD